MRSLLFIILFACSELQALPWSEKYHERVMNQFESQEAALQHYPAFQYPNRGFAEIVSKAPKVLIFGYGSLMSKSSLLGRNASGNPTVKPSAIETMRPVVAFGVKRLFNLEDRKGFLASSRQFKSEKAYLNLMSCPRGVVNGIVMEVDQEDLARLVKREEGYDLVPILVASWEDLMRENPQAEFEVAYTFMASDEPREGILYTSDTIYPILTYVRGVEAAAATFGPAFLQMYRENTYLADGRTTLVEWDCKYPY